MSPARRTPPFATRTGSAGVALGACALLVAGQLATVSAASAAAVPAPAAAAFVDLGSAETYSILAGAGVANTGADTVLAGDLGLSTSGAITGFPPGIVHGETHDKDAAAQAAEEDRAVAYDDAARQASTEPITGDLAGKTFVPGVYTTAAASSNTGTITLDANGDPSAVFIFQIGGAMSPAAGAKVVLVDGALANNVFWQATGAVSLGADAKYVGTILGATTITFGAGASIKGRALTPSTVTVTNSPFTEPVDDLTAPLVTIDGGATSATNDTTPPISGTTDEPAGATVTVTVGGQILKSTVRAGGVWSVSAGALAQGDHDVVATITDASRNVGTATQVLTVDVTAPFVSIDGGAWAATKNTTPTISGTTNTRVGSNVTVTVDGQTLHSAVGAEGAWSVDAAALPEDAHHVVASAKDFAQNTGTASQVLTVDLTLPVVTINGGATRSTADTSPWTYGTTAEKAGTIVHVTIGGQNLAAEVASDGTWGVSAAAVPPGTYEVTARITDAAHNTGRATQTLTITGDQPATRHRPDAAVRTVPGQYVGTGIYDVSQQRVTKRLRGSALVATFQVRVTNRGNTAEQMTVLGTPRNRLFKVAYLAGGQDVTVAVTAGTYSTSRLAPKASADLVVKVTRTQAAKRGDTRSIEVRASSSLAPRARDTVAAVVQVAKGATRS